MNPLSRVLLTVWAAPLLVLAADTETSAPALFTTKDGLPIHTADYAPRSLVWEMLATPTGVKAVYPHPARSQTLFALTAEGLLRSDDDASNWRRLPLAGLDAGAAVTALAFRPCTSETFCFGTRAQGVWITRDGGQTAQRIGAASGGLASDTVVHLAYAPDDPFFQTILVAHGKTAPGLSKGNTESKTWKVVGSSYAVYRVLPGNAEGHDLYLFAAEAADPEAVGLYYAPVLTASWQRLLPDTLLSDGVWQSARDSLFITTLDKGVIRADGRGGIIEELGGDDLEWFSADATWGVQADQTSLCLYQPSKQGLLVTSGGLADGMELSRNLYRGSFVSEGSAIRANAGGTRFYGAINGALWVGHADAPLRVDTVSLTPDTLTFAESAAMSDGYWRSCDEAIRTFSQANDITPYMQELTSLLKTFNTAVPHDPVTVRAHVTAPMGSVPTVTADLSRFGLSAETPLAPTSNGVYETSFHLAAERISNKRNEWRSTWPGPMPVTVTARVPDAQPAGGVGVLALYTRPENVTFWGEGRQLASTEVSGPVSFDCLRAPRQAVSGQYLLNLTAGPGAWQLLLGLSYRRINVAGYYALTFQIHSVGPETDDDLFVHLGDNPLDAVMTVTPGVPLIAGKHVEDGKIVSDRYRRVCVPLADCLRDTDAFRPELLSWVGFSGNSKTERTYFIDNIRFIATREEWEREVRNER